MGAGQREAISLAEKLHADQLIVDDMTARREAERRGLTVIGTLGVLREASADGLLDLRDALQRLSQTTFHVSPDLIRSLLGDTEKRYRPERDGRLSRFGNLGCRAHPPITMIPGSRIPLG